MSENESVEGLNDGNESVEGLNDGNESVEGLNDGNEAKSVKEVVLFPALSAILKPSAETLGQELNTYIKRSLEKIKAEKRQVNVEENLRKVQETLSQNHSNSSFDPSIEQLDLYEPWLEGIQDIEADDEIAILWREILVSSATGGENNDILFRSLRSLNKGEAIFFLNRFRAKNSFVSKSDEDLFFLTVLEEKNIVEGSDVMRFYTYAFFGVILIWIFATSILSLDSRDISEFSLSLWDDRESFFLLLLSFLMGSIFWVLAAKNFLRYRRLWRLTWIGKQLIAYCRN